MSCTSPCLTCISNNFYSCSSCDPSINSSYELSGTQCIITPTWYIQLACTCTLFLFILLPLIRKRSMVLTKILDIIQTVAFFKYINGFIFYRHNYLYLEMRSMTPWNEGWQLLSISNDLVPPIYLTDQSYINKLIRIGSIWAGTILLVVLVGIFKICCKEGKLQFGTYVSKNITNAICIAFYVTIQDIAFYCAANFFNYSFTTTLGVVHFVIAIILSILVFILIIWQFSVVNYKYQDQKESKLYNYQVMFMYRMDYDLFQTYSLTNLPQKEKKIQRYSNIAIIDIFRKIGYAFLIVSHLSSTTTSLQTEIYSLVGYLVFFQLLWYISLPFDPKKQIFQLVLNILADLIMLTLLIIPLFVNNSSFDFIYFILCLSLFGLAIVSAILQIFLDLYTFIPYDLYNLGLTVVIEDKQLRQELNRRKKEMEQNDRKIKELREEHERLLEQLKKQKENQVNKTNTQMKPLTRKQTASRQNESQVQIMPQLQRNQPLDKISQVTNEQQVLYPADTGSQDDNLDCYKIDTKKKRMVYSFNKKVPFVYSNKVDQ